MPLPSVSVILPNYNHAPYLSQCLNAILDQSVKPKEVIVIDDASTDNSVDVISEFAEQNSSIKLILNRENMGKSEKILLITVYQGLNILSNLHEFDITF